MRCFCVDNGFRPYFGGADRGRMEAQETPASGSEAFADKMRPHRPFFYSNAKMRFQSLFMLITVQPRVFASSMSDWGKVPTLVSGSPPAGP
jgi:hypothetical protein